MLIYKGYISKYNFPEIILLIRLIKERKWNGRDWKEIWLASTQLSYFWNKIVTHKDIHINQQRGSYHLCLQQVILAKTWRKVLWEKDADNITKKLTE